MFSASQASRSFSQEAKFWRRRSSRRGISTLRRRACRAGASTTTSRGWFRALAVSLAWSLQQQQIRARAGPCSVRTLRRINPRARPAERSAPAVAGPPGRALAGAGPRPETWNGGLRRPRRNRHGQARPKEGTGSTGLRGSRLRTSPRGALRPRPRSPSCRTRAVRFSGRRCFWRAGRGSWRSARGSSARGTDRRPFLGGLSGTVEQAVLVRQAYGLGPVCSAELAVDVREPVLDCCRAYVASAGDPVDRQAACG